MRRFKNLYFYSFIILIFSFFIYWIFAFGKGLEYGRHIKLNHFNISQWNEFLNTLTRNITHPLAILLAQIVTIIIVARILGWLCKKIGQPSVIGEIAAGILLGPSFIGMYFPEFSKALFPTESLNNLQLLSQVGLILFMFMVGMELDLRTIRNKASDAFVISQVSIIIPFTLGAGLAYIIYQTFAPQGIQFLSFGLFIGIAMSITAFPVLARIVHERNIHKTRLGAIVITSAAVDDVTAWCLLAAVIAIVKAGSFISSVYLIILAVLYVLIMLGVVRPFLKRIGDIHATRENLSKPIVAIFFLTLILSAFTTEIIGIHALFGAFMAGAIMPDNMKFRSVFIEKVEDVALVLLLPLFFVFTGLRTEIGLLNDVYLWKVTGLIILVAITGKFVGSAIAAKYVGQSWKDSLSIGALMNTRGLMELVVLNIGYDLGVLGPEIFAMMVIMALVTTFMTGPALDLINFIFKKKKMLDGQEAGIVKQYKILISFANPEKGKALLRLASQLVGKGHGNGEITIMHLSPNDDLNQLNILEYERESFAPLLQESKVLNRKVDTVFRVSNDIKSDIPEMANKGDYNLLMVGLGKSIYEGSLLGKILGFTSHLIVSGKEKWSEKAPFEESTRMILAKSEIPVGILIDKNLSVTEQVLILIYEVEDLFLLNFAQKLLTNNPNLQITLFDATNLLNEPEIFSVFNINPDHLNNRIHIVDNHITEQEAQIQKDLLIISLESWKNLVHKQSIWLVNAPSTLIIKP